MVTALIALASLPSLFFGYQAPQAGGAAPVKQAATQKKAEDIFRQALPSIVIFEIESGDGRKSSASGFLAVRDGVALTSWSSIAGARSIIAKFSDGDEYDVSGIIDTDTKRDLALIRIKESGRPFLRLESSDVAAGATAIAVGPVTGPTLGFFEITISKNDVVTGSRQIQFSLKVPAEAIGAPLLSKTGTVIGILTSGAKESEKDGYAIPAKYGMGLDASLPTRPLDAVRTGNDEGSLADVAFTNAAIAAITNQADCQATSQYVMQTIIQRENGFKDGVPALLYEQMANIDGRLRALQTANASDDVRRETRDQLTEALNKMKDGLDLLSKSIMSAQAAYGWTADPVDLYHRAMGTVKSAGTDRDSVVAFLQLPDVKKRVPEWMLESYGLAKDPVGFRLDTVSLVGSPLEFLVVPTTSFAATLGFVHGDKLQTVEGKPVGSLDDFKARIKRSLGTTLKVGVLRQGKAVEFDMKVPNEIPATSLIASS